MKAMLQTIAVAFSMFSAVPMPQFPWDEKNMRYALCCFPLVGVLIGGLGWLWWLVCGWLCFPALVRGAGLCLLPLWVTGGLHMDGYCDTHDALASHAGLEKRQEILQDPHIGAFGVLRLAAYLLASLALWTTLPEYAAGPLWLSFVLSRSLSGLAVATFPLARGSGLAYTFAAAADKRRVACALRVLSAALGLGLCWFRLRGLAMVLAALLVYANYRRRSERDFGGLSGDLAGWFLQRAELGMLAALWLVEWLEGVL